MSADSQRVRLFGHLQEHYNSAPEYLWENTPDAAVFRHPASQKWFALFMGVAADRIGLEGNDPVEILNVKCDPLLTGSLRLEPGFFPAYHMNKNTWITILLDGTVPDEQVIAMLEDSYDSVRPKKRR